MGWASKTYTFSPSTTIASAKINQNFDDLVAAANMAMPSGGILIWSGAVAAIPAGYYLCDGNNGTPDLRGKFVLGAGGAYAKGATGGEETHTLTSAEMPVHSHTVYGTINSKTTGSSNFDALTGSPGTDGNVASGNAGSGAAHNNMPPYLALAYIMKS